MIELYAIDRETQEKIVLGYCDSWNLAVEDLIYKMDWNDLPKSNENYRFGAEEM